MSILIDGTTYNIPFKSINRKADVLDKYADRTEDGVLHREIIGVYYNYDVEFGMSANNVSDYAALYLKVTEPTEFHTVTMPGESGYSTPYSAYFANVRDEVVKWNGSTRYFRNLSFSIISKSPARTP